MRLYRDGEHTGLAAYPSVNIMPRWTSESMWGGLVKSVVVVGSNIHVAEVVGHDDQHIRALGSLVLHRASPRTSARTRRREEGRPFTAENECG
jgi:hypothetical protein